MSITSAHHFLNPDVGILREPGSEGGRIVLWVPGDRDCEFRPWERIAAIPGGEIPAGPGVRLVAATSVPARQRLNRGWVALLRRSAVPAGVRTWLLPGGGEVEQAGERREGLVLAWSEDGSPLGDWIARRWPDCGEVRRLGAGLYLVAAGVEARPLAVSGPSHARAAPRLRPGTSREMVRQALAVLVADSGAMAEKAALWERLAEQVVEHGRKRGSNWGMERLGGHDGSIIFMGRASEFLVFDVSGRLFRGQGPGCLAGSRGGRLLPHYPGMRLVS